MFMIGFAATCYLEGISYAADGSPLVGNHPGEAVTYRALGDLEANTPLAMEIRFALRNTKALDKLLVDQQNPASPKYHKWLKTGEFQKSFGASDSQMSAVADWLTGEGFTVTNRSAGSLQFNGAATQAERTFAVRIAKFGNGSLFANTSDPVIPAKFSGVIGSIRGMDNIVRAIPMTQRANSSFVPSATVGAAKAFGPADFHTFYDETVAPGSDGTGDCIAVVGTSDFLDSTMAAFTTQFGLPPIDYRRELHGDNPGINGAEAEAELDLQWSHSAAPGASIVFHLGSDLVADINGAVSDNQCGAISISYGYCGSWPSFMTNTIDPMFRQAAAQGQSVFVSAGDQGAAGLGVDPNTNACIVNRSRSVNELSADPNVTSVGGTQFTPKYSNGNDQGYAIEKVWNDGSGATGGGASQVFGKPSYQTLPATPDDGARDVPDIVLVASPNSPGVFFADDVNGVAQVVCCIGGTSLSAPAWAGFSRVLAQLTGGTRRLGNINPVMYQLANSQYDSAGFHDVTIGDTNYGIVTGFNAGPGYDLASGWGSVDFDIFAAAFTNSLASPTPSASATATPTALPTATATATTSPTPTASPSPTTGGSLIAPRAVRLPATRAVGTGAARTFLIGNRSRTSTMSLDIGTLAQPLTVAGSGHYMVAPASTISVTISIAPGAAGMMRQTLVIHSGDAKRPTLNIAVSAMVRRAARSAS
jgi:subtilase family serine protease